jgi:hypothetical protein
MAVKTFTTGEVLTAADTNTYLNNGGLVYITQASWASGGTVSVNNCFTSTYSAYRLVVRNVKHATTDVNLLFRLRASGTDAQTAYYWGLNAVTFGGTGNASGLSNDTSIRTGTANASIAGSVVMDVVDPQKTSQTSVTFQSLYASTSVGETRNGSGFLNNTTAYDGFSFIANTGNLSALTVFVYGYRES